MNCGILRSDVWFWHFYVEMRSTTVKWLTVPSDIRVTNQIAAAATTRCAPNSYSRLSASMIVVRRGAFDIAEYWVRVFQIACPDQQRKTRAWLAIGSLCSMTS
jgi:hypothetical protein